jgi:hypothetical protein
MYQIRAQYNARDSLPAIHLQVNRTPNTARSWAAAAAAAADAAADAVDDD